MYLLNKIISNNYYHEEAYRFKLSRLSTQLLEQRDRGKLYFILHCPYVDHPRYLSIDLSEKLDSYLKRFSALPEIYQEGSFSKDKLNRILKYFFKNVEVPALDIDYLNKFSLTLEKKNKQLIVIQTGFRLDYEASRLNAWQSFSYPLPFSDRTGISADNEQPE